MPAQETTQPQVEQMALPTSQPTAEQPRTIETMAVEPMRLRGGADGAEICCGLCAAFACFECCKDCC